MPDLTVAQLLVLVVEPSTVQRRIIVRSLRRAGVEQIQQAGDGAEAFQYMRAEQPDLVVSALYLPDMTGTDLVHAMREAADLQHIAFVLVSSETRFRALDPIRQAGAIGILPKPFEDNALQLALASTLELVDPDADIIADQEPELLRVLVVDDSSVARSYITHVLGAMGIKQITEAADGAQALDIVNRDFFDFIVTDYNMPRMDGKELVESIRQNSLQASVPVLMVTSEASEGRLAAVEQAGVSAICDKPFEPGTIKRVISNMLHTT